VRIVQALGWYLPDSLGGSELYVAALADRLRRRGHEVQVTAPDPGRDTPRHYVVDGVPVFRYPTAARVTRAQARGEAPVPGTERLHQWFAELRPDLVHVHTFVTGLGLLEIEAARRAGAAVVVTSHAASLGFVCERGTLLYLGKEVCDGRIDPVRCAACGLEQRGVPLMLGALAARVPMPISARALSRAGRVGTVLGFRALIDRNRAAQRRLFDAAAAVVVLSGYARGVLLANGAPVDKVVVNRLGVAPRPGGWTRKPGPEQRPTGREVTFGFVGRAEPIKGLEDAVRAVISLPDDVAVRLRAVVVAATADERALVERCRTLARADPRVAIDPGVPPEAMPALLAAIDALVCPSRAVEGGPTVALEAFAVGTPVVGAAVPALSELVEPGRNGALHAVGDWRALAAIMRRAAADPGATIDRWRRNIAAPRTFDDIAADYEQLYARAR
jgi:glycosyltransferase involved in cell wall biosynthesis